MIHTDGKPTIACRVVPAPSYEPTAAPCPLGRAAVVPTIAEDSLLQMDRFESFRAAYAQAAADPHAVEALSRLTPELAYNLFESLKAAESAA